MIQTLDVKSERSLNWLLAPGYWLLAFLSLVLLAAFFTFDIPLLLIIAPSVAAYGLATRCSRKFLSGVLLTISLVTAIVSAIELILGLSPLAWTGNINLVAYICVMGIPVAVERNYTPAAVLLSAVVAIVGSAGALLILLGWIAYHYRKHWLVILMCGCLASFYVMTNNIDTSYGARLGIWSQLVHVKMFGPTTIAYPVWITHSHNLLVQISITYGAVLGGVAAITFVLYLVSLGKRAGSSAVFAIIYILVSSSVDYLYWWPGIGAFVVVMLAWSAKES